MGQKISKLVSTLFERRASRIIMVGLDGAGKTTILYKFKLDEIVTSIPTVGFNVETVRYKDARFTVWDIGGQDSIRPMWKRYFRKTHGIIFVVDATDRDRIEEAAVELRNLMTHDDLQSAAILVFANKQDLPHAMKPKELVEKLRLYSFANRRWYVQSACASLSLGLYEGLEWLSEELARW